MKIGKNEIREANGENQFSILIEEAGGIEKLEDLTVHAQAEVSAKATKIIDDFFGTEEPEFY